MFGASAESIPDRLLGVKIPRIQAPAGTMLASVPVEFALGDE